MIMTKNVYFGGYWGLFVGRFEDNLPHRHYATQISVSSGAPIRIVSEMQTQTFEACLIKGNALHQFQCSDIHLLLLISPTSSVGHFLNNLTNSNIAALTASHAQFLQEILNAFVNKDIDIGQLVEQVAQWLEGLRCQCQTNDHWNEDRITKAILFLEQNYNRVVSLSEIADYCHLSESRFLHLFRAQTGISYRRFQLWNKIAASVRVLTTQSITQTAHEFGFTDSAHYCKTFKENFGFSPKFLAKI